MERGAEIHLCSFVVRVFFFMSRCHFPSDACSSCAKRMTSSADSLSSIWANFCRLSDYFGDEGEWKNVCLKALIYDNMQSQIKTDASNIIYTIY